MARALQNPVLRWLLQTKRIPLLFSVTVVSGIFYHYAPAYTPLWILLSLLIQSGLFLLFDYIKKHPLLGGAAYGIIGIAALALTAWLVQQGYWGRFAPEQYEYRVDFFVWFLTPQAVFTIDYPAYTFALFILFTFFIATVAYYFTLVRYRVLMSFLVMLFPFAIYAKESETMPVPSIIILFVCYFAVMIYCRGAHAEDREVSQPYTPGAKSTLQTPSKKSAYFGVMPEMLDGGFIRAAGLFLTAATILVLVVPKPTVKADRQYLDSMLDMSSLTNYLMRAISGFADSSDGGSYTPLSMQRTLFYTTAPEPLDLRIRTFSDYSYETDSWSASARDRQPEQGSMLYSVRGNFQQSMYQDVSPAVMLETVCKAAAASPAFAESWGLSGLSTTAPDLSAYACVLTVEPATGHNSVFLSPTHPTRFESAAISRSTVFQSRTGILFSYENTGYQPYTIHYLSDRLAQQDDIQLLMHSKAAESWFDFLLDMQDVLTSEADTNVNSELLLSAADAALYGFSDSSETPERVIALADELTADCTCDYERAAAICDYLKWGDFAYSKDFPIRDSDNVETFLFENRTGVCYQFASAMTELCRAAGMSARYVEGYAMTEPDRRAVGGGSNGYEITTDQAHAFTEVFIPGYGWMMFDATSGNNIDGRKLPGSVITSLQYSGLVLFCAACLAVVLLLWVIPAAGEQHFRRKYRNTMDGKAVIAAFGRLRRQWHANPAMTARTLCAEYGETLQMDLSQLCAIFEEVLYAGRCTEAQAAAFYTQYIAAREAWKRRNKTKKDKQA